MGARRWPLCAAAAGLFAFLSVGGAAMAADPAASPAAGADGKAVALAIGGLVKRPLQLTVDAVRTKPVQQVDVTFQGERGVEKAHFTGASLWALLEDAGGIDDSAKGAVLRHTLTVTGRDGYVVILSTGEISPEFGAKEAMIAYERDGKALDKNGLRLIMPGDKRGGRDVRDLVEIDVK